jgi:long-chain acyl-CoA synthetase
MSDAGLYPTATARTAPERIAYRICETGETVTYGELEARSNQVAHLFRRCGLAPGDHVVIVMENNREFFEVCFGADRAGLYYTTVSTRLMAHEIAYIIGDCGARLLITSSAFAERASLLAHNTPALEHRYVVGGTLQGYLPLAEALAACPANPIDDEVQGLDMLYSSGTTGRPKGVKWPMPGGKPGELTMLIDLLRRLYAYGPGTRYLSPAPLYHAAPLRHSMTVLRLGGTVWVMQRFDAEAALRLIESELINCAQWVPTMFVRMLKLPQEVRLRYDMSSLQMAIHAAAPCPIEIKRQMIDWWGPIIHEYYAGTENNGFCAIDTLQWLARPGSVGPAVLGELHVCDEAGEERPVGETGLVYFANGHQFSYHNDPDKTAATRNAAGWSTLGDVGKVDADGYLYLVDRKAFMIISGGVNIYPQEAENLLFEHPDVIDVAVFGVPNEDFGEEVKAVVQPRNMALADAALAQELIAFCRARLSAIKCPRTVDFEAELPRHPTGKLYKRLLRDRYWPGA